MKKITYVEAINAAIEAMKSNNVDTAYIERMESLKLSVAKRNASSSEESKAKSAAKRKEKSAIERAKVLADVVPALRAAIDTTPRTADEIFQRANLSAEWTLPKVRYILTHKEMGEDVITVDNGRNPKTYHI